MTITDNPPVTATGELAHLDPATLLVDGNVRAAVELPKDFVDSIREHGVLVPIVAVRTAEGAHRVRYGQRRVLGALEAGRPTVPVVIVGAELSGDAAEIDRIVTQVHENEQRSGLSASDQAVAVEQLAAFGLSAGQIAKKVKTSRADVDHALAIVASPLAKKAVARYTLTLSEAAAVAEFQDDTETVTALIAAATKGEGSFAHVAQRARDDRARDGARIALEQQLTQSGVWLLDRSAGGDAKPLSELVTPKGAGLVADDHSTCAGHAVDVVQANWQPEPRAVYYCTDWKAQGHRDRHQSDRVPAVQMTEAQREKASADRRTVIENNKAWTSAEKVRRAWLATFLTRKTAPKGSAVFIATELAHSSHELGRALEFSGGGMLNQLIGVKDKAALVAASENATEGRAQVLALAFVLAAYEAKTGRHTWRANDPDVARYFAFLVAQGYELADVEKLCLAKPARRRAVADKAA